MFVLGIIGFLVLVFLPGAWITFGLPLEELSFSSRLILGAVLAPLVVCLQFYAIRLLGVSFELTVILLIVLQLPVLFLVLKRTSRFSSPDWLSIAGWAFVLIIPIACLVPIMLNPQVRVFTGHAWSYTDPIYQLANGRLLLEDPELAGVRFAYPWAGLIYQGILSYLIGSPPASSYIWTNVLWLLFIYFFIAKIVGELGGSLFSRLTSVIWLSFGVNFVGFILEKVTLAAGWKYWMVSGNNNYIPWPFLISGDYRYTPWLLKFMFFEQEPLALGIFIGLLFLLVKNWDGGLSKYPTITIGFLLVAEGLVYPPLFPAAGALVGAKLIAMILNRSLSFQKGSIRKALPLALILVLSSVVTLGYVKFLTQDRVTTAVGFIGPLTLSTVKPLMWRIFTCAVVSFPLLVGLVLAFPGLWKGKRSATIILVFGALASFVLFIVLYIPGFNNEYKYIFTAAICLAPFSAMAIEPLLHRNRRKWVIIFGLITLVMAFPIVYKLVYDYPFYNLNDLSVTPPQVDTQHFDLRLVEGQQYSALCDIIRLKTPPESILLVENGELHLPTLTQRSLYVPPVQEKPNPGINIKSEDILEISRGYSKKTIEDRREIITGLFASNDDTLIAHSLNTVLQLNRPTAIIVEETRHANLLEWLARNEIGESLYEGNGFVLWLILPDNNNLKETANQPIQYSHSRL